MIIDIEDIWDMNPKKKIYFHRSVILANPKGRGSEGITIRVRFGNVPVYATCFKDGSCSCRHVDKNIEEEIIYEERTMQCNPDIGIDAIVGVRAGGPRCNLYKRAVEILNQSW